MLSNDESSILNSERFTIVSTYFGKETSGVNAETWKVSLLQETQNVTGYLKFVHDSRQAIAEFLCSELGKILKLKIPDSYLVYVDTDKLPDSVASQSQFSNKGPMYCFASISPITDTVSFERLIGTNTEYADSAMKYWKDYEKVIAFDQWVANPDRTSGNFLFCPLSKDFWLIDHGSALTGDFYPNWALHVPGSGCSNALLDMNLHNYQDSDKQRLQKVATTLMLAAAQINLTQIDEHNFFDLVHGSLDKTELREFLRIRIELCTDQLCEYMGIPKLSWN